MTSWDDVPTTSMRREHARLHARGTPRHNVIQRRAQTAMVFVLERYETERLQYTIQGLPRGAENFGHAMHRTGLRLERDFHEVALHQRFRQAQQASGGGDGLEFGFGAAAVLEPDRSQDGVS